MPNPVYVLEPNFINAVAMGADPTGVTDSAPFIQDALDTAKARGFRRVYIPAGEYLIGSTLILDSCLWLQGEGMSTYLRAKNALDAPIIQAYYEPGVRWSYMQRISDMRLDGNRDNQTATDAHGIEWLAPNGETSPILETELVGYPYITSDNYSGTWFDTNRSASNLFISFCKGNGFHQEGRGGGHFDNIVLFENEGYGIRPTYDTHWTNITAGRNGSGGFLIQHSAIHFTNCKAWWSGYRKPDSMFAYDTHGWTFNNSSRGTILVNCEAQDNFASGFAFTNCYGHACYGCVADSNNQRHGDNVGVDFYNAYGNVFTGIVYDRYRGNVRDQASAIRFRSTCYGNKIDIMSRYYGGTYADGTLYQYQHIATDSDNTHTNEISINNYRGMQALSGGTLTIDPYKGSHARVSLNTNTTINADTAYGVHDGAELEITFIQDATGSRTVSFDADFDLGSGFTVSSGANTISTIRFRWVGFKWAKVAEITGV